LFVLVFLELAVAVQGDGRCGCLRFAMDVISEAMGADESAMVLHDYAFVFDFRLS
jgi:hypothetical protein